MSRIYPASRIAPTYLIHFKLDIKWMQHPPPPPPSSSSPPFSIQEYESLSKQEKAGPEVWCNLACCYFMLGLYKEANEFCLQGKGTVITIPLSQPSS